MKLNMSTAAESASSAVPLEDDWNELKTDIKSLVHALQSLPLQPAPDPAKPPATQVSHNTQSSFTSSPFLSFPLFGIILYLCRNI